MPYSTSKILKTLSLMVMMTMTLINASAQSYYTKSKKASDYFQKAQNLIHVDNVKALKYVDKALKLDTEFLNAILLKAELCQELNMDSTAMSSYERLFMIDSMAFPKSIISLSKLYTEYLYFDKSISCLIWYLSLDNQNEILRNIAEKQLILTEFRKSLVENPVSYNPENIGNIVNSHDDEFVNHYYANENKLVLTRKYQSDGITYENVFVSMMIDSIWTLPTSLFDNITHFGDVGAAAISHGDNAVYFSGCGWNDGRGSCDIYTMNYYDGKWSEPRNLDMINTSAWESQPCISYDGDELYFVRRDKTLGTSDIFMSKRDDDGCWMKPEKLVNVNTEGNEMAPFIHDDGKTLYFSSDTHLGMGGYDLFVSQRNDNGEWTMPKNLGYPLNTQADEINIVVSNDAVTAFISSEKDDGCGGYDIYKFDMDENFRPQYVELSLPSDEEYYADKLTRQESVVLNNIYFDFDSFELLPSSEKGIDLIVDMLNTYPELNIEIVGHTDDMGDADYNLVLSKKRADAVKTALINKGVMEDRIETRGLGASKPLVPNNSDKHRALNRRVEMKRIL